MAIERCDMTEEIPGPAWTRAFVDTLRETGQVKLAIRASGVSQSTVYLQRRINLRFSEAWDAAAPPKPARAPDAGRARVRSGNWRPVFLEALAETSNITAAAVRANVPLRTVYKARRADEAFAANWQVALHEGYDMLEMDLLGYLRDPQPGRKMDVPAALRLLAAHRDTVERRRAVNAEEDEQALLESIDRFIDDMRERRAANTAILIEAKADDGAE
jgi:hypothetical protein